MSNEPVLTIGVLAGIIVFAASKLGIVLDQNTVNSVLVALVPVVSALIARFKVTPV